MSSTPPKASIFPLVTSPPQFIRIDLGIVLNANLRAEDNTVSTANKASRMLFYLRRSFAALTSSAFPPVYKILILPHLEYAIQTSHPILRPDAEAVERVQMLVKGLLHVPYESAFQQLRLFSLTHR